jgi:D-aminopeptidase
VALNAITDVTGVRVGHATIIHDAPSVARTGVTAIWPAGANIWTHAVTAGLHAFNGNGEMTGTIWIDEQGLLATPLCITNTHSVGLVRDAVVAYAVRERVEQPWLLPVVGETYDGWLSEADRFPVTAAHAFAALDGASGGAVSEGCVGGGTGMICHEFKGGIGTASRVLEAEAGGYTVGVLVQANHGARERLTVNGVPVGERIPHAEVPDPYEDERGTSGTGSIIVVVATDAPLLPHQCERAAQRAGLGIARAGGTGGHTSGDLFIAFATGNRIPPDDDILGTPGYEVRVAADRVIDAIFDAVIEATEEAIINALVAAETMTGRDGITAYALPHDRLLEVMARFARGPRAT